METCALSLRDDLGTGALDDGEEFLLFLVRDLDLVERSFQVAEDGVELGIADVHPGVGGFYIFAVVMNRAAGGEEDELIQMLFEVRHVLIRRVPGDRLVAFAMKKEAAALFALALPVDAGVLQHPGREIVHNGDDAFLAAEAVEERELSLYLGGLISPFVALVSGSGIGGHRLLRALFPSALAGTGELLVLGHSLTGPLVSLAAAGGEEIILRLFAFGSSAADDAGESRREEPDNNKRTACPRGARGRRQG
jgi:hypothetical protein